MENQNLSDIINLNNDRLTIKNKNISLNDIVNNYVYYLENNSFLELENCIIDFDILSNKNIFYLKNSKLTIKNSEIFINNRITINILKFILFNIDDNSELNIINSNIYVNNCYSHYIIINSKLSIVNIKNSLIEKNPIINLNENKYVENSLITNIYSQINIDNSKLINNLHLGKIAEFINLNYILQFDYYQKFIIKNKALILDYNINNFLYTIIKGIICYDKVYIFNNYIIEANKIKLNLDVTSDTLDDIIINDVVIDYLFFFNVYNSLLKENIDISLLNEKIKYPKNYVINILNSNLNNKTNNYCNLFINKNKFNLSKLSNDGNLYCNNIHSNNFYGNGLFLKNLGLKKYKNNNLDIYNNSVIKGENNINFCENLINTGNNSIIFGKNNKILGNKNFINGFNNQISGNNNNIFGDGILGEYNNSIVLGNYNEKNVSNYNTILEICNGKNDENRNTIISLHDNYININTQLIANKIETNNIIIENDNITGVKNLEIEENLFIDGDLKVEEVIEGINYKCKNNLIYNNILNIQGELQTIIHLQLKDFTLKTFNNSIIGFNNQNGNFYNIDENVNGILYKCEIICIEQPDYYSLNILASKYDDLKTGHIIENRLDFEANKKIVLFSSKKWNKGMKKEFDNFHDNELFNFNLYISKFNISNKEQLKFTKGKFIIKFLGMKKF